MTNRGDLKGMKARFNSGSVVHRMTSFHRKSGDGTVDIINSAICGVSSPTLRGWNYRLTDASVSCKNCLKRGGE